MITALIGFSVLLAVVMVGVPLGTAMILIGVGGFALIRGLPAALTMAGQQILDLATNYDLSVLPMFLLMGILVQRARLSDDLYKTCNAWLGHLPGGLALATIGACGGFAAVCGSSMATAATMSKMAMPPMRKFGYSEGLGAASIAAGGTLGILIPPSVPMVLFGILTQTDIGKLFIAGIVPGLIMIAAFFLAILTMVMVKPSIGPRGPKVSWGERIRATGSTWAVLVLFLVVLGGIYLGVFTPTEAAGIGSAGALLFALSRKALSFRDFVGALLETGRTTTSIFFVAFGALIFATFLTLTGMIGQVVGLIGEWGMTPLQMIFFVCVIYFLLGCVFESMGMMILTVPVFYPIAQSLGIDPIWFGIIVVIMVELSLITPPIGMNLFVVKKVIGDLDMGTLFLNIWPFVGASVLVLVLVIAFPSLATYLPTIMAAR